MVKTIFWIAVFSGRTSSDLPVKLTVLPNFNVSDRYQCNDENFLLFVTADNEPIPKLQRKLSLTYAMTTKGGFGFGMNNIFTVSYLERVLVLNSKVLHIEYLRSNHVGLSGIRSDATELLLELWVHFYSVTGKRYT